MAEQAYKRWLKQAEADYDVAEFNFGGKKYYACANYSQQTVEKALKAVLIYKEKKLIKTHSITKMARHLGLSESLIAKIAALEPIFVESKYPDLSEKIPAEEYEEEDSKDFLNTAEEILIWAKNQIKQ